MNIPLGPFTFAGRWVMEKLRGKLVVSVRVHHAYLIHKEPPPPAFFINVQNESPKRSISITHVWLEADPPVPILTKPLPHTVKRGHEWETFILERDAPSNDVAVIAELTRVRISGDRIFRAQVRTDVPPVGYIPDG